MYSGVEYIVCCYSSKNQPDHGGNRTRDLWFASPMLYQLSYKVKSVRVFDISELNLAPSISVHTFKVFKKDHKISELLFKENVF